MSIFHDILLSSCCTAHGKKSLYFTMGAPFPQNCPLPMGDLDPHLIYDSFGQSEPTTQMASPSVQPFLHRRPRSIPILYNEPLLHPQNCPSHGVSAPPFNIWFPGPTQVLNPNGISIGSAIFARLTSVTDQPTDQQTTRPPHLHT